MPATLLILALTAPLTAQVTFSRTYGGTGFEVGSSVAQTTDGGYIIAGGTDSYGAGGGDVYLVKTDVYGDTMWTRTYGGTDDESGKSVAQTTDGGYIIAGITRSFGAGEWDVYLVKTDASGDTVWTRVYGDTAYDLGWSVAQTTDGGYVIAGYTKSFGGNGDVYLIKTDANGDTVWTRAIGGTDSDHGESVAQTTDGGYIITGKTKSYGVHNTNVYLVKTDANGDTMWARAYGGRDLDGGESVAQTTDGGYIIAGWTWSFGGIRAWLIKTDASGDTIWTRAYGGSGTYEAYSVAQTTDGGYIMAGLIESYGGEDVLLIRTDASGDSMWARVYGGTDDDWGWSVKQTSDGGYVITGETSYGAGNYDVWLIKTDSAGNAAAIAEPEPPVAREHVKATIVRGVLRMPETEMTNDQCPMTLLDISGREVSKLHPGDNDVRHLSPGVYFVRQASSVRKVIVAE